MKTFSATFCGFRTKFEIGRLDPNRPQAYFAGDYQTWELARRDAEGYDSPHILDKAVAAMRQVRDGKAKYERDTVTFDKIQISHALLAWLLYVASRSSGRLSVMDFGGALGSSYYQNCGFLDQLSELRWGVVEQENFVKTGLAEFQTNELRFFYTLDDCVAALGPNVALLSSVLQYIERPHEWLSTLLEKGVPYVLIDRTMAHRLGRDRIAVQKVPTWIYDASYPVWFLDADKLEHSFDEHGYEIVDTFDPYPGSYFGVDRFSSPYSGWFLRKRGSQRVL